MDFICVLLQERQFIVISVANVGAAVLVPSTSCIVHSGGSIFYYIEESMIGFLLQP